MYVYTDNTDNTYFYIRSNFFRLICYELSSENVKIDNFEIIEELDAFNDDELYTLVIFTLDYLFNQCNYQQCITNFISNPCLLFSLIRNTSNHYKLFDKNGELVKVNEDLLNNLQTSCNQYNQFDCMVCNSGYNHAILFEKKES